MITRMGIVRDFRRAASAAPEIAQRISATTEQTRKVADAMTAALIAVAVLAAVAAFGAAIAISRSVAR